MSAIATALKHMLAAGMPHDAIVAAVAEMEAATENLTPRQARNRRYYEAKKERLKASENRLTASESGASENRLKASESVLNSDASPAHVRDNLPRLVIPGTVGGVVGGSADAPADDWPQPHACIDRLIATAASPWLDPDKTPGLITTAGRIAAWKREGASWTHDVVPVVTALCRARRQPISTWKYFDRAIAQSIADNRQALTIPEARTHDRPGQDTRNTRAARRGVWAEVLAEERGEGTGDLARTG